MISQISWGTFMGYLGLITGIYYIAVVLIYYKQELSSLMGGRQAKATHHPNDQRLSASSPLGQSYDYGAIFASVNSGGVPFEAPAREVSLARDDQEVQENHLEKIDDELVDASPAKPEKETFEDIDLKDLVKYSEISS